MQANVDMCPMAIFLRNKTVLLGLRHYEDGDKWTTPGGRADAGENVELALRREVAEETGITDFEIVKHIDTIKGVNEGDVVPFFVCRTEQEAELLEPEKFSKWGWFGIENFPEPYMSVTSKKVIFELLESDFTENNL